MSRVIADGLSKRATATTQEAEDAVEGKYPDAAGVHAAFGQYGPGFTIGHLTTTNMDVNNLLTTGFFAVRGDAANRPPGNTGAAYNFIVLDNSDGFTIQQAQDIRSNRMFTRHEKSGVWSAWREVYNQSSILGPVSQSAGVPTGAIIERGSNLNGEYVKFADGTVVCTGPIEYTVGGGKPNPRTVSLPINLTGDFSVQVSGRDPDSALEGRVLSVYDKSSSSFICKSVDLSGSPAEVRVESLVFGRWF